MCDVGGKDAGGRENEDSWQRGRRGDVERAGWIQGSRGLLVSGWRDPSSMVSAEEKGMGSGIGE